MAVGAAEPVAVRGVRGELRGTQSFVRVMEWCWQHPAAVALEVAWRWLYGVAVLGVVWWWVLPRVEAAAGGRGALARLEGLSLLEPTRVVVEMTALAGMVGPVVGGVVVRVGLPLMVLWILCSTAGRWFVLRRVEAGAASRLGAVALLQGVRLAGLGGFVWVWGLGLGWAARRELSVPVAAGQEPALVGFFAEAIVGTLVLFVAWSLVSYLVSLPPLLAMCRGSGAGASLRAARTGGELRMKLIEVNLVMGIVKVALVVLLMVFSACPLPFQSEMTTEFLLWWTGGVGVLYLLASDFFHVARQVAYLRLWAFYRGDAVAVMPPS